MHHWCRGREGCCCNQYPERINSDASRIWKGHGVYQDLWSPGGYTGGNSPTYVQFPLHNRQKGLKQLLVKFQNALYGTMFASLLHYRKFTKSLTDVGFKINPYDLCAANKMIDGQKMTICYHVYNCKLIQRRNKVNDRMINLQLYTW